MQRKQFQKKSAGDASKLKVGVVVAQFNSDITQSMLEGALGILEEWKVQKKNVTTLAVPGSYELPIGCQTLIRKKKLDAVIAIGCVIKGETDHDKYIASAVASGLMRVSLDAKVPVSFGVLTVNSLEQAKARSRGATNHGCFAAEAALSSALGNRKS